MSSNNIGIEFIKELRESLATESRKFKWHRKAMGELYANGTCSISKAFIFSRYLGETDDE